MKIGGGIAGNGAVPGRGGIAGARGARGRAGAAGSGAVAGMFGMASGGKPPMGDPPGVAVTPSRFGLGCTEAGRLGDARLGDARLGDATLGVARLVRACSGVGPLPACPPGFTLAL
jgi:hypothetical protein